LLSNHEVKNETMSNQTVLLIIQDATQTEALAGQCAAMSLNPVASGDAAHAMAMLEKAQPALVVVDESAELRPDWPLYHEIALHKPLRSVPLLLLYESSYVAEYAFPHDQCVYRVKKGPRALQAFRAVAEELVPVETPVPSAKRQGHSGIAGAWRD
jgi:hypothetical protein